MTASSRQLHNTSPLVLQVDISKLSKPAFTRYCVGCLVLTQSGKILLQQRDADCATYPGCLATFGGGIKANEVPMQALVRELIEELGAEVNPTDVISLGAITEAGSHHKELIYIYFWHDKEGTITGCYEGQANYYDSIATALAHPKVMDDVNWLLQECKRLGFLKK